MATLTRLICTECGKGNLKGYPESAWVRCTHMECAQVLSVSQDILPYADGQSVIWTGAFLSVSVQS